MSAAARSRIICPGCGSLRLFVAVSPGELQCGDCGYVFVHHLAPDDDASRVVGKGEEAEDG